MKKLAFWSLIVLIVSGCGSPERNILTTTKGNKINLSEQNTVLMWLASDCPLCQTYSSEYRDLASNYNSNLQFVGVLPGNWYTSEEMNHFIDSFHFDIPIVEDKDFYLTKRFNAIVTPEFVLIDTNLNVQYQGKFDDWATGLAQKKTKPQKFYLINAIDNFLNNQPIIPDYVEPVGCTIEMN